MKVLIDMNLPPAWMLVLEKAGHQAVHWSDIGPGDAPDAEIMQWAREHGFLVFTHDLDFTALLAATQAVEPSVIQLRVDDVLPDVYDQSVLRALERFAAELEAGALISIDPTRARVGLLPFGDE